ncbi:MAG: hypothetical protein HKN68_16635, partial [Saprospiraceae bacterium]|nr:hypothetical protein [Saprospiraceae bacterium]
MIRTRHFIFFTLFYLTALIAFGQKEVKTYYDVEENQVKEVFEVKGDGTRTGEYIKYHFDGAIIIQGKYRKGQKTGTWNYYHSNGVRSAVGDYEKDTLNGRWVYYHRNGQKSSEGDFANGIKNGKWISYN